MRTLWLSLALATVARAEPLTPRGWDPALAGDLVMERMIRVTAPHVKGAHDAEFVCVGDRAYIVEHDNDVQPGHGAGHRQYCVLSIVNLHTLAVERTVPLAKSGQAFENETLPPGACFVPRILEVNDRTLRCYFASEDGDRRDAQTWTRDFDLRTLRFENRIYRAQLQTAAGVFDMQPQHLHADAAAQGFTKPLRKYGLYLFDSFKRFDGRLHVALNNYPAKQNALALVHDDLRTFEVLGHFNEPQTEQLSESAVNRLPNGTWMAICRNDGGNYRFATSRDGRRWCAAEELPVVTNGLNSKPTFDRFAGVYYLGWQENTSIQGGRRSVFNLDISRDGKNWECKYRFEAPDSFQYPTFHEHDGAIWFSVTQGHKGSTDRIMFGKLEETGAFASQTGKNRKPPPLPRPEDPPVMRRGVKLFLDRDYVIHNVPEPVRDLPFLRTSIERVEAEVTRPGPIYALTPSPRPKAACQETALRTAGFTRVNAPETQLFPGEINRVSLYEKQCRQGDRLRFGKLVVLVMGVRAQARLCGSAAARMPIDARTEPPVILTNPGAQFQDDARPGAMIIGMDRTRKGRIWGCWTGTGDKADGYFLLATSDDGGATWSKPRLAIGAPDPSGRLQRGALVGTLWTDPLGRLWVFFDQRVIGRPGPIADWYIRCDDPDADQPVWSEPVCVAEGSTLNKPTVLDDGAWLLPVSHWADKRAWVYASTDQGKTWTPRGSVRFPDWEFDEHMIVKLRDGRLWMLARTKDNPHEAFSTDQGATWSEPRPSAIRNVNARFFLRRLASGRLLLVKNGPVDRRLARRAHMTACLSDDDGKSWSPGLVLDERASVSYPDGFEAPGGLIHILYDWNRHTDAEILLAKFREQDVLEGRLVSRDAKLRMLANKATGPKPILYNGIELPLIWPPRHMDPDSTEPMPVPYLDKPPRHIPIDVGRQLFVDDFLIEQTDLRRTFHAPQKFERNPVFKAETVVELEPSAEGERNESATVFLGQGGVFWDPTAKHFKMFYVAGWRGPLALATSTDMVHWTRPDLGLSGGNALLPRGLRWTGPHLTSGGSDNCVWLDVDGSDPARRLKFLTCWMHVPTDQRPAGFNHSLHEGDGRSWSDAATPDVAADDYCSFFFNPYRRKWCFSIKQTERRGRCRYYLESDRFIDGTDWSRAVYWTNADRRDRPEPKGRYPGAGDPPQLYGLNAVAYESLMIGMHYIHRGPANRVCAEGKFPKLIDLELGFSRDGFHWHRPDRRPFLAGARVAGAWDRGYLHSTAGVFVVLDDRLVFPYTATSGIAPTGARGMYTGAAIGIATLRRDGFASMEAGDTRGTLTTRLVNFRGQHLFVNLDAPRGELRVEVLTADGRQLADSKPITGDATRQRVQWSRRPDLAAFRAKNVRFRFHLVRGRLYSFWVTQDPQGASNGYVAAGGPGFAGTRDTPRPGGQ